MAAASLGFDLAVNIRLHLSVGSLNLLQMKFRNPPGWMRRDFNYHCDSSRVCAEWNFSCHCQQFPSVDTYRKMSMANMATGVLTTASVIIHNWHVCTYGGLINDYFGVKPPTLVRYFLFSAAALALLIMH